MRLAKLQIMSVFDIDIIWSLASLELKASDTDSEKAMCSSDLIAL